MRAVFRRAFVAQQNTSHQSSSKDQKLSKTLWSSTPPASPQWEQLRKRLDSHCALKFEHSKKNERNDCPTDFARKQEWLEEMRGWLPLFVSWSRLEVHRANGKSLPGPSKSSKLSDFGSSIPMATLTAHSPNKKSSIFNWFFAASVWTLRGFGRGLSWKGQWTCSDSAGLSNGNLEKFRPVPTTQGCEFHWFAVCTS